MSDLISRQAAIDALNEVSEHYTNKGREWHPHINFMVDAIRDLPSAQPEQTCGYWDSESKFCALYRPASQPEQKKGKWIVSGYDAECSNCHNIFCGDLEDLDLIVDCDFHYCPNCGAKMEGGS